MGTKIPSKGPRRCVGKKKNSVGRSLSFDLVGIFHFFFRGRRLDSSFSYTKICGRARACVCMYLVKYVLCFGLSNLRPAHLTMNVEGPHISSVMWMYDALRYRLLKKSEDFVA